MKKGGIAITQLIDMISFFRDCTCKNNFYCFIASNRIVDMTQNNLIMAFLVVCGGDERVPTRANVCAIRIFEFLLRFLISILFSCFFFFWLLEFCALCFVFVFVESSFDFQFDFVLLRLRRNFFIWRFCANLRLL